MLHEPGLSDHGTRLLVVDDDETNRLVVRLLMERRNYEIIEASSGFEALQNLRRQRFVAVLMDLSMPGMSGFETTERIRSDRTLQHDVPIIALTAHTTNTDRRHCHEAGMCAILPKPFDSRQADALLSLLLSESVVGAC